MKTLEDLKFTNRLDDLVKELDQTYYVQSIYDPVQTHAVYGVYNSSDKIAKVKSFLKEQIGAKRFRVVKTRYQFAIVCFKAQKTL